MTYPKFVLRERLRTPTGAFVAITLILGSLYAFMTPGLTGYDEGEHFLRAWQLSNGHITAIKGHDRSGTVALGEMMPSDLRQKSLALFFDASNIGKSAAAFHHMRDATPNQQARFDQFEGFSSSAIYPPVPYIPAAVAIRVARTIGLSVLATVLLSRFASLLAFVAIVVLAIRRIPRHKWLMCMLAAAPVCTFQASMISADGITIALALLVVACALRATSLQVGKLTNAHIVEAAVIVFALGLAKPPYIMFAALFGPAIWKHRHHHGWRLGLSALPGIAAFLAWSAYAQSVFIPPIYVSVEGQYAYRGVDTSAQLAFLRTHPASLFAVIGRTIGRTWAHILHDSVAQVANWPVPTLWATVIALSTYAAIAIAAAASRREHRPERDAIVSPDAEIALVSNATRFLMVVVALSSAIVVFLLAYTGWNQVAAPHIDAFQGRYLFLPIALLVFAFAPNGAAVRRDDSADLSSPPVSAARVHLGLGCVVASSLAGFVAMLIHYY